MIVLREVFIFSFMLSNIFFPLRSTCISCVIKNKGVFEKEMILAKDRVPWLARFVQRQEDRVRGLGLEDRLEI